jgi:predicted CopG family antitoxin
MWCSDDQENSFSQIIDQLFKQREAIAKLSEYVDRINSNSNSPFSDDVEEEIKKILE